ncbi:transposase [Gemmatimonadetes bacterium T265]|nr:transposase [Gemmatimonadetes bacterium T265]
MLGVRVGAAAAREQLEAWVPADHLLRRIDRALDLTQVRAQLVGCYSRIGRPSVDPELLLRLLLVGYLYGITSERRLVEEVRVNVAYRWFAGLPFGARVPHHSTFSKNRHGRFGAGVFRAVFEAVVRQCVAAGLVVGGACSVDGSMVNADASSQRWTQPTRLKLTTAWPADGEVPVAPDAGRPPPRHTPRGLDPPVRSPTDPDATWASKGGPARFAYYVNYLVDNARGVIVDVEATAARYSAEALAARVMIERTRADLGLSVTALGADRAYGSGPFLEWCRAAGVTAYVPVLDRRGQTRGQFTQADFAYDGERDEYVCPGGERLRKVATIATSQVQQYRAPPARCTTCALRARCTTAPRRQLSVSGHDAVRRDTLALAGTPEFTRAAWARKKVEARFAELKRFMRVRRLRLRGLPRAAEQFLLAATAQNLKRLAAAVSVSHPAHVPAAA